MGKRLSRLAYVREQVRIRYELNFARECTLPIALLIDETEKVDTRADVLCAPYRGALAEHTGDELPTPITTERLSNKVAAKADVDTISNIAAVQKSAEIDQQNLNGCSRDGEFIRLAILLALLANTLHRLHGFAFFRLPCIFGGGAKNAPEPCDTFIVHTRLRCVSRGLSFVKSHQFDSPWPTVVHEAEIQRGIAFSANFVFRHHSCAMQRASKAQFKEERHIAACHATLVLDCAQKRLYPADVVKLGYCLLCGLTFFGRKIVPKALGRARHYPVFAAAFADTTFLRVIGRFKIPCIAG